MISRYFTPLILSVVVLFLGCSSTKQVSSDGTISKEHPQNDILFDNNSLETQMLPTAINDANELFFAEKHVPHNVIKLNVGPSLICSDVVTSSRSYEYKLGLEYGVEYQHFWHSGFGVGANLYYFNSHFGKDLNMDIQYMGPLVAYSDYLDSKGHVRVDLEFGVGCGILKEKGFHWKDTETKFAAMVGVGVECAVAKNVAFGLQFNWNTLYMTKPKGYYLKDDDLYGIERCSLLTGVRVYF